MTTNDNNPFVILFNGPPRSGKDTIAQALRPMLDSAWDIPSHVMHFATPMRDMAMGAIGEEGFDRYNEIKDQPQEVLALLGLTRCDTVRKFMIALSEHFMKERYGKDIWGRILINIYAKGWWGKKPSLVLIPDLGFQEEYEYLLSRTDPKRVLVVQTLRQDCSFDGDSRSYIKVEANGPMLFTLNNNGSVDVGAIQILNMCKNMGWVKG